MREGWHVGRKAIIAYLDPFLSLAPDPAMAWKKIRRWRIRYGLPIDTQPSGKPYIDPDRFVRWWNHYQINVKKAKEQSK